MTQGQPIRILLHLSAGGLLALVSIFGDHIVGNPPDWGPAQAMVLAAGLVIMLTGFMRNARAVARASTNICVSLLTMFVLVVITEGMFWIVRFDFAKEERAWRNTPVFWRYPMVPTGEAFFRRSGPQQWTGQVLNAHLMQRNLRPNPYSRDPVITVKYNSTGFRNSGDMLDWDVVVVGDSFTELGYLRSEELFTTILADILGIGVLNLGTSHTGPLTQLSYLRDYGISSSTKQAVIVFFEGNDLRDLGMEYDAVMRWKETGERDYREFRMQHSFVRALYRRLGRSKRYARGVDAYFTSPQGNIPITLSYTPPDRRELSEETIQRLDYFFGQYAGFGREQQITVWLAYMPSKRRVLHGQVEFSDSVDEKLRSWRPTDLPQLMSELCDQYGIEFIDLTPALVEETRNKTHLVYNSMYDTHLNSIGSLVVAREMARYLAKPMRGSRNQAPPALAAPMQAMVSADAARPAMDLLDDPLVHELVWAVDEHGNVARLRSAVAGMSRAATNPVDSLAPRYPHAKQIGHFAVRWRE